jgi:hypothetical protein
VPRTSSCSTTSPRTSWAAPSARWATPRRCRCSSFIKHFRDEFEHHIQHRHLRRRATGGSAARRLAAQRVQGPRVSTVQIELDGQPVEVRRAA